MGMRVKDVNYSYETCGSKVRFSLGASADADRNAPDSYSGCRLVIEGLTMRGYAGFRPVTHYFTLDET